MAIERCAGPGVVVPQQVAADVAAALGEALAAALVACSTKHDELIACVERHSDR